MGTNLNEYEINVSWIFFIYLISYDHLDFICIRLYPLLWNVIIFPYQINFYSLEDEYAKDKEEYQFWGAQ